METHFGPLEKATGNSTEITTFRCKLCLVSKPKEFFSFLPCCSTNHAELDACASCVAIALTKPSDNKCPRCREFVQLVSIRKSEKPPNQIVDVQIEMGAFDQCLSCGETKRLIHPDKVCQDCQRAKDKMLSYPTKQQIRYECQVCHEEQPIPHPIYKTQPTPRHYGSPAWVGCNSKLCRKKDRRWRIVESELDKLKKGSAPHPWAQYFVRKDLGCLPDDPAKITTETKLNIPKNSIDGSPSVAVGAGRFAAVAADATGNSFVVPSHHFPILESWEDDNDEGLAGKTTLRLKNERTQEIHPVLAQWLPNGFVHWQLISSKSSIVEMGSRDLVIPPGVKAIIPPGLQVDKHVQSPLEVDSATANPPRSPESIGAKKSRNDETEEKVNPNAAFLDTDWLVAIDYLPLLSSSPDPKSPNSAYFRSLAAPVWSRQEFSILGARTMNDKSTIPTLGWNAHPYNVRIGKIGIFAGGNEEVPTKDQEGDIILEIDVKCLATALWTDAVDLFVSLLEPISSDENGDNYEDLGYPVLLLQDEKHPSIRRFPDGKALHGPLRLQFSGVSFESLKGLASPDYAGGLHLAFLAPSTPVTSDDDVVDATERPVLTVKPSFTGEELRASTAAQLRSQIRAMTMDEKRERLSSLMLDDSHREQFQSSTDGKDVDAVLESMLENEDFVRRYMRSPRNDGFGWVDANVEEDKSPSLILGHAENSVTDPISKSGAGGFVSTFRTAFRMLSSKNDSAQTTNSTANAVGTDNCEDKLPGKPDSAVSPKSRSPMKARVEMDGTRKEIV
ncbi:unnamed protein product [Cylindrotheca closterium]|uniref:Uncharacterized protein n=1 Tax=Cylindrotheca closterium TaxID=2856 RepID=A0AAD2JMS0_9STRA|nr:unnamed protein product [Cylindrotheca closterium]